MSLNLTVKPIKDMTIVECEGRIDGITSEQLQSQLMQIIEEGQSNIILDMTAVNYISSVGFRVFLIAQKKTHTMDGQVVLCGLKGELKELFKIAGFTAIFKFVDDVTQASKVFVEL